MHGGRTELVLCLRAATWLCNRPPPPPALCQAHFESVRAAELVAAQRLEAAERRKLEERERRLKQVRPGQTHGRPAGRP